MHTRDVVVLLAATLFFVCSVCARANETINIALIADKASDLDKSPLVSLLEVKLSQIEGVQVLERAQIDKILQEQKLSLAGLLERDAIIEAGRLLRADAFILLSQESTSAEAKPARPPPVNEIDEVLPQPEESPRGQLIRIRIAETTHGLRLLDRFEELDGSKLEEITERIVKDINAVVNKLNLLTGQAILMGIVDIHRVQLGESYKLLERILPVLLSIRLSKEPKIIMLEREDLKILLDEKLLTEGRDSEFWGSAILIDGYLQPKDGDIEMTLHLRKAVVQELCTLTVPVEPNEPLIAIDKVASKIIEQLQDSPPTTQWQPELEAQEFYRQGKLLSAHTRYEDSIIPFETAHAMQPQNVFYTGAIFENEWASRNKHTRISFRSVDGKRIAVSSYIDNWNPRYTDLELAELVSLLVRQIRDGYEKGFLSSRDIYDQWTRSLGCALRSRTYFADPVSVATEQIRQINRENRRIWVDTMDKALRKELLDKYAPEMNTRLRARLAWISSDDPHELIVNLKKAFKEFVMPLELGGTIESAEEREHLFYQAFQAPLRFHSPSYLDHYFLKGSSEEFLRLWRNYLKELTEVKDMVIRINSYMALSIGGAGTKEYEAESSNYSYKVFKIVRDMLTNPNESLDNSTKRQILRKLRSLTWRKRIKASDSIRMWEDICGILMEQNDIDSLATLNPGWRPFRLNPFDDQQFINAIERYYYLLERIAIILQTRKGDKQVTKALSNIRDFQAEIRKQFFQSDMVQKQASLSVIMLLNKDDWLEQIRFSGRELQIELHNKMLWIAFRDKEPYNINVGLVGIDLERKKSIALWQAEVPFTQFPRLTGMAISQDVSFLSLYRAGIVELPGSLIQGSEYFIDPNNLHRRVLRPDLIERIKIPKEGELIKKPKVFTQEHGLPSILITSIAKEADKLWIAYGGGAQESGLGLYDPETRQWETVFCSTLKDKPPFNAGKPYGIYSLTLVLPKKLFFLAYDIENSGLWKMDIHTRELKYIGPVWTYYQHDWVHMENIGRKIFFRTSPYFIEINPGSEKMRFVLGSFEQLQYKYLEKNISMSEIEKDIFASDSFSEKVLFGPFYSLGHLDLSTSAIYNNYLWARLGESQIIIIEKGKDLEDARIIDNNILDGESVYRFVGTPYGLVAIGNGTVGLVDTE